MKEKKRLSEGTRILYNLFYMIYQQENKEMRGTVGYIYTFISPFRTTKEIEKEVLKAILYKEKGIF